ncbi:pyridoxamine 5'-phosphate oxidase family protein [Microbacterium terregens]|uniref:Pyridoxamine 5'-phosphate oxidase family protein n=1 Tax=Microbacterium terregens TaxID=69363 RepID=A0ABV5SYR8_9MICO
MTYEMLNFGAARELSASHDADERRHADSARPAYRCGVSSLTPADRELLSRPLQAMVTVQPARRRWPAPRPVWFELTNSDAIQIFSFASTTRVARLREVPRASIVVAAPLGEAEQWVSLEGSVTLTTEGAYELAERLTLRYYAGEPAKLAVLDDWRAAELVRIVFSPERVSRYAV